MKTYNYEFDLNKEDILNPILDFITETKNGNFSNGEEPQECRLEENYSTDNYLDLNLQNNEVLLLGLTY